ncbi:protocadherin-8-like [Megalops cyprinoides]|uniref:protocadherin-8-like n=1 Tax=Megalops cyprinoides TaxID=118141 RepID=UPI0018643486|nr:protocadherin-8-like [Megalops cyprinoides]
MILTLLNTVESTTAKYKIYEEEALGTEIGNLSRDFNINPAEDTQTSFRFMEQANSSMIHVSQTDGLLTVREVIDREQLCPGALRCHINFDIVIFYKEKYQLIHVEIEVKDINDNSPQFPHSETYLEISESAPVGSRIPLDIAVDQDVGSNYIQSYQVSSNIHFGIDVWAGEDGIKHAELVLLQGLDREVQEFYTILVSAADGGSPPRSGSVTAHIKVLDSNDNTPTFEHSSLKVEVHEDAPVGFLLLNVHATDPDEGINGEVVYGFVEESSPEINRLFQIDPFSGALILKASVDFEDRGSFELNIKAYDLGVNSVSAKCKVIVEVVDVNDNAPEISIKPMTSMSDGIAYITEGAAEESFVALIRTSDRDSGLNGEVRTSLQGHEHFKLQQAYGDAFMIVTTTTLDREKIPEYNLTVIAEDRGSAPFKTVKQYTIRVSDENDNAPLFSKSVYEVSVIENNVPGSYVTTVVARDLDVDDNGKVMYKLVEREEPGDMPLSAFFSVNPLSGSLYAVRSFDYELVKLIEVNIQATDRGFPQLSSTATIRIRIVDQNDNSPYITYPVLHSDSADVPIPYNAPSGYRVLQVKALDADDGVNGELTFQILEDTQELFHIDKDSGDIVLKHDLRFVCGEILKIKIAVSDKGRSPLSRVATVRFLVTEMQPIEDVIIDVQQSNDEERWSLDISFIIIVMLGGGCALLLIAIVNVAFSWKHNKKERYIGKTDSTSGLFEKSPRLKRNLEDPDVFTETGLTGLVNVQTDPCLDGSTCLSEDSRDSETEVILPSKSFEPESRCIKPFGTESLWQVGKYSSQLR